MKISAQKYNKGDEKIVSNYPNCILCDRDFIYYFANSYG